MQLIHRMWRDDDGQDLVEYALIAGLISVVCYLAIEAAGTSISTVWSNVATAMGKAATGSAGGSA